MNKENEYKCNGWKNYETWNFKTWLENDENSWNNLNSIAKAIANRHSNNQDFISNLAEWLKLEAEYLLNGSLDNEASFANDLLNSARNRINYRELAESYMEDYYGNQPSEEI